MDELSTAYRFAAMSELTNAASHAAEVGLHHFADELYDVVAHLADSVLQEPERKPAWDEEPIPYPGSRL